MNENRVDEARLRAFAIMRVLPIYLFGGLSAVRVAGTWTGLAWALAAVVYARWLYRKGYVR